MFSKFILSHILISFSIIIIIRGFLSKAEFGLLEEDFNFLINSWKLSPEVIIYMRANPEVCYKRIQDRGRSEEKKITLVR